MNRIYCAAEFHPPRRGRQPKHCWDCQPSHVKLIRDVARARWSDIRKQTVRAFNGAIRRGEFPSVFGVACKDCGAPAKAWDHRDYSKPFEVEPVCISCNGLRGSALHAFKSSEAAHA